MTSLPTAIVGGVALETFRSTLASRAIAASKSDKFWSTPERPIFDPTAEVLEINFNGVRLLNHVVLSTAHFPHVLSIEWFDENAKAWEPLRTVQATPDWEAAYEAEGIAGITPTSIGSPVTLRVADSAPAVVNTASSTSASIAAVGHPQHNGPGHWLPAEWHTAPVSTSRVRVVLVRADGTPPRLPTGESAPYSLGIKGLKIGYQVNSRDDTPARAAVTGDTFGSSVDLLGSRVTFSLREQKAMSVLDSEGTGWRSEPMPVNYAVVNLYADTRTGPQDLGNGQSLPGGEGQVIDRFFVDPLTVGAHLNLYYSNDVPDGSFAALDEPLNYPLAQSFGSIATGILDPVGAVRGMIGFSANDHAYVDIDNAYLQFAPARGWWLALDLIAQTGADGMANGVADHPWASFGGNTLRLNGANIEFISATGKIASVPLNPGHSVNSRFQVGVIFNPDSPADPTTGFPKGLTLVYRFADRPAIEDTRDIGVDDLGAMPTTFSMGRYNDASSPGFPAMSMRSMILKVETPIGRNQMDAFCASPELFTQRSDSASTDLGMSDNALLRAHPDYAQTATNPVGLVGGPGDRYANMVWTPIQRDYVLKKGFLNLPPTRAKFFKFEFTQLVAEHYESYVPIQRAVHLFPAKVVSDHATLTKATNWSPTGAKTPGVDTSMNLTDVSRYADAVSLLRTKPVNTDLAHTATEALYVPDLAQAAKVASLGWIWTYQPWHIGSVSPKFVYSQKHEYETVVVEHRSRVGFFAGVRFLQAYRVDYLAVADTARYDEQFHDQVNIDNSHDMSWGTNQVVSFASGGAVTSKKFPSGRSVRGVQFATVQSDSFPLLPDDGFVDTTLSDHWSAYGDAAISRLPNRTVQVNRGWRARLYGDIEADPTLHTYGLLDGHLYAELEGDQPNGMAGGGLVSEHVTPTSSGRVYAAVKVSAAEGLSGPITLEIVSVNGDVVLSSADRTVVAGQDEDFFIGYEVGSAIDRLTYGALEGSVQVSQNTTLDDAGDTMTRPGLAGTVPTVTRQMDGTTVAPSEYVWTSNGTTSTLTRASTASDPTGTAVTVTYSAQGLYGDLDGTTYGQHEPQAIQGDVYARLVQHGRFGDSFLVKRLSIFDASLTWEFSNDDGTTWWDGTDVRNNPDGVLHFPTQGSSLRWRLRAFHPRASVSALAIRPWYGGLTAGIPSHSGTYVLGPNRSVVDDYPEVHLDPMWQQSGSPIPAYWYAEPKTEPVVPPVVPAPEPPTFGVLAHTWEGFATVDDHGAPLALSAPGVPGCTVVGTAPVLTSGDRDNDYLSYEQL